MYTDEQIDAQMRFFEFLIEKGVDDSLEVLAQMVNYAFNDMEGLKNELKGITEKTGLDVEGYYNFVRAYIEAVTDSDMPDLYTSLKFLED